MTKDEALKRIEELVEQSPAVRALFGGRAGLECTCQRCGYTALRTRHAFMENHTQKHDSDEWEVTVICGPCYARLLRGEP